MAGISINCELRSHPHVQSMMYAMDRIGLQTVVDGGAIYDCEERPGQVNFIGLPIRKTIIWKYEIAMSDLILNAGYGISSTVQPITLFKHNSSQCLKEDIWYGNRMEKYFGRILSLDQVVFFKTSRYLTPETASLINFTLRVDWNEYW